MSLNIGTRSNQGKWGAGFSYEHLSKYWGDNIWGLGYGAICNPRWSWGVSATRDEWDSESVTWVNAGLLHSIPQPAAPPIKVGLIMSNILEDDNDPRFANLGVAVPVGENLLLAADYWDVHDEWWEHWNFGAEMTVSAEWCMRLGRLDESWTAGVGHRKGRLSLDAAYIDREYGDSQWLISTNISF